MQKPRTIKSQDLFFPLAAGHAALTAPLAVLAMTGTCGWPPGLIGAGHGFEMFFGFALTIVAGYVLGPLTPRVALLLLVLWAGGRVAGIFVAEPAVGRVLTAAFALVVGWHAVPRFRHAKKWRNRAIAWILAGITLMPLLWLTLQAAIGLPFGRMLPAMPLWLFALIMAFMGGRIIAPAAAGTLHRQGVDLEARVQPRIEGGIVILGGLALLLLLPPGTGALAGAAAAAAGLLVLVRLLRWRLWRCRARADLVAMGVGYAWLGAGLVTSGFAFVNGEALVVSVHVITVGALGTLSSTVMLNQVHQRWLRMPARAGIIYTVMPLLAVAVTARIAAGLDGEWRTPALWLSASSWTLAYLAVLVCLLSLPRSGAGCEAVRRHSAQS